jgi:hypothetical protein
MKHILNNLTEEEKNSIREQHTGGKKIMIENFNKLINSKLGDSKPLMEEEETSSKEGRNNPVWINLVSKLKNLSYSPKILTYNSYDTPPIPTQSMNWGTTKGPNGNYGFAIASTDHTRPKEEIQLFCDDKLLEKKLIQWWADLGYKIDRGSISVDFKDADNLKYIIESFFKKYPPSK